ncbi:RNA-binding (RRM/RBD/RNP motifs) family protein [Actinidia rufa]|uniref:RNA-binding (RRM/RBD/RNP motifs) family protein n=1 Tax=Actinidia rufa TaxID=165716 RepID=A0A7J0FJN7_9ERIC|nr:RNA-binding (RRM/RBD/RNP motifs) family protein [Actinidia rufa]
MGLKRQWVLLCPVLSKQPPLPVVRLRGLPFDCSEADIVEFFHGLDIVDVLLVRKNDKFTGKAFCVLAYPLQVDFALQRNKQNIGRRYVEISRSKRQTYYKAIANEVSDSEGCAPHRSASRAKSSDDGKDSAEHTWVLLLKGLPFSAGKDDIMNFFNGFALSENLIHITATSEGRPTGEAFVEFASEEDSKAAMERDGMTLGNRYIELFPSSHEDLNATVSRAGNYFFY